MKEKVAFKEINRLAIPAIIAGVAEPLISLTDIGVIGNVDENSVEALAAAGIVGSFISAIVWTLAQTKTSISALVSQHLGAGKLHEVKTLVPQAVAINLLLGIVLYLFTFFFAEGIFKLYNAEDLILAYSVSYYKIRAIGFPITLVTFAIFGVFRGIQNTLWAMKASLTGMIVNILFDYLLVYGVEGLIPAMHLQGAAYASIIAQLVMLCMALYFLFKKTDFNLRLSNAINNKLSEHLSLSVNLFLRTIALNVAIYLANAYATDHGKNYIAAQSVLMNIWLFFSFFVDGYSNAGNALAGKLLGAKDYRRMWFLSIDLCKFAVTIALVLMVLCAFFYDQIGPVFSKDEAVLLLFAQTFWVVLAMQPINAITFVFDGIFKGMGEAKYLRNVVAVATFVGFWPVLLLTDLLGWKLFAIWTAFVVWMLIRGGALIYKFRAKYVKT